MHSLIQKSKRRLARRFRILSGMDKKYEICPGVTLYLPPQHLLHIRQVEIPTYDRYFHGFFIKASVNRSICVIDIGANVGDTAVAISSVAPRIDVICVEGSPFFLRYLVRNTKPWPNIQIIDRFLEVGQGSVTYRTNGSTGQLVPTQALSRTTESLFVSLESVFSVVPSGCDLVIWKSDTDGYDISLLLNNFDLITKLCEVVWFEYDPIDTMTDPFENERLIGKISTLDVQVVVFDNLGNLLLQFHSGHASNLLKQLTEWLISMERGGLRQSRISYFDVWLMPQPLADLLTNQDIT